MTNNHVQQFLLNSFERLDQRQVPYVVIRNAEELSNLLPGTDVDILVRPEDIARFEQLLDEACQDKGGILIFRESVVGSRQSLYFFPNDEDGPKCVSIDLKGSIHHCDVVLIPAEEILEHRRCWQNIWRPSYAHESVALLFHAVLDKGSFHQGYGGKILELRNRDRKDFSKVLRSQISDSDARWVEACLDRGAFEELVQRDRWIGSLISRYPARRWVLWQCRIRQVLRQCKSALLRRGALVTILGPDGVGKSTLTEALSVALERLPIKVVRLYFGVRTPLLPTKRLLRSFHTKRRANQARETELSEQSDRKKRWTYFLGTMHNLVDHILRYWVYARFPLARGRIVLCDRYFYDAVTAPIPAGLHFLVDFAMQYLIPQPDLTVVLTDDSNEIYRRKPELSCVEIEHRQNCYTRLFQPPFRAKQVVVDRGPAELAHRLVTDVMIAFGRRNG